MKKIQHEIMLEKLETWARWREYRTSTDLGWPKYDTIGKAMTGLKGIGCPTCGGKGRVPGEKLGIAISMIICPTCGGTRTIKMNPEKGKANPAFIPSTVPRNYNEDPDSLRIDHIICTALTEEERTVLLWEYTRLGRRADKVKRLDVTSGHYRVLLHRGIGKVESNFFV